MIYLDNAATTFPKPEVVYAEMDLVNRTLAVNTGRGSYKAATKAQTYIDESRNMLGRLFGCSANQIVLTPSVTYAINEIIKGLNLKGKNIYISPYEHNAVARALELERQNIGFSVKFLPLCEDLTIDLDKTKYLFSLEKPDVVILSKISNVTGYILPTSEIFTLAKSYNSVTVLDAAQAAGLIELNMSAENANIICFAGHKTLYGPFGIAGFAIDNGLRLNKSIAGGTGSNSLSLEMPDSYPSGYEIGSHNIVAIAGLWAALKNIDPVNHFQRIRELTDYLYIKLSTQHNIKLLGAFPNKCTLGIISFVIDGYTSADVGQILDEEFDIAVRTGYHCAPFIHKHLHDEAYGGTVRVSIGMYTEKEDIEKLIMAINSL